MRWCAVCGHYDTVHVLGKGRCMAWQYGDDEDGPADDCNCSKFVKKKESE